MDIKRSTRTIPEDIFTGIGEITYYNMVKYMDIDELYNLDSQQDFRKFATDHYGELGLSRLNISASDFGTSGWRIIVFNSYSSHVNLTLEVATALYKAGAPLKIYDSDKLLKILREEDYVKLTPYTFHDYMSHHEEGSVYELPQEYECGGGDGSSLTLEQYNEIVSLAEQEDEAKVMLKNNVI